MSTSCLCVSVLLVHWVSMVTCLFSAGDTKYGVIMDAGSSGTKVKVYSWPEPKTMTEVPTMRLIYGKKFRPGVGHFARRSDGLTTYLSDMLANSSVHIPESKRNVTPVYLMATAGARVLDGNIALSLLRRIRNTFYNKTLNPFRFQGRNVKVLSGEEEGVFAWISLNALTGFFNSSRPAQESYGILEMGGGSTQIAFVPNTPIYAGEFHVMLWRRLYDIYVHSYLFYGANYIKQRVFKYLVFVNPGSNVITDPCRLTGDDVETKVNGEMITFVGSSDPGDCRSILAQFTRKEIEENCHPKPCAIGSVYQPSVGNTTFYAINVFAFTPQTLRALDHERRLNISKLEDEAMTYCQKNLDTVLAEYRTSRNFASEECLIGLYIPMLFLNNYQLNQSENTIIVNNKVNGQRIDWAMGALLFEINIKFQSHRIHPRTHPCVATTTMIPYREISNMTYAEGESADPEDTSGVARNISYAGRTNRSLTHTEGRTVVDNIAAPAEVRSSALSSLPSGIVYLLVTVLILGTNL